MTNYKAYFHSDGEYAIHRFEADTPEQALALARQLYDDDPSELMFYSYDDNMPVNEIQIIGPKGDELALWRDENLWLCLAAGDVLTALQAIFKWWTETPAFRNGEDEMPAEIFDAMRFAIAKATGGAL
jgi:hypothetical protein